MAQQGTTSTKDSAPKTSLFHVLKVLLRLGPKQINDEITLALQQMKAKGVAAGVAAALMVVGVVFITFLVVALIVAAIAVLALFMELWVAALIVAGAFLLIALLFALIGFVKFKGAMPLVPEDAIRGFRLDLGVAKQGTDFDPASLDRADEQRRREKAEAKRKAAEEKKKNAKKPGAGSPKKPSYAEVLRRTTLRREHIAGLQDAVRSRLPKGKVVDDEMAVSPIGERRQQRTAQQEAEERAEAAKEFVSTRWKPLAVAAGATAAGAAILRELVKK